MIQMSRLALAAAVTLLAAGAQAAPRGEVLVLLSSEHQLPLQDGKRYPTGYYLNEFGVPADQLLKAGYKLVLVTPKGNAPSVDPRSIDPSYFAGDAAEMKRIEKVVQSLPDIDDTLSVSEVLAADPSRYAGLFIPGGHAPLIDLANNPEVGALLRHFHQAGKPTAAICHGPIALLSAQQDPAGYQAALARGAKPAARDWVYKGYRMTIFSDPEEQVFEGSLNGQRLLFYPAGAMAMAGGDMGYAKAWQPNVVVDRELITAQNPFSDKALAKALLEKLAEQAQRREQGN
ncbi:type 1 glutamine amidotransferase domain-containing protein [Pseudomonas sp. UBA4617]|uniref:type 1 glutamine amidotransferase domain-containing protein n=1 Tax=Pseudomonas sp. UBA4617 TaxID=1947318 RepID=UPI0025CBF35B|nr:type 1 glutamine amidotransferase domain-containing protein [Pseudomonas sp. UBA4617]